MLLHILRQNPAKSLQLDEDKVMNMHIPAGEDDDDDDDDDEEGEQEEEEEDAEESEVREWEMTVMVVERGSSVSGDGGRGKG